MIAKTETINTLQDSERMPQIKDKETTISIIIPTLNEGQTILSVLKRTKSRLVGEVIVVDGGSQDDTVEKAHSCGATVLKTRPGRAHQMNLGAEHAQGDILLFLHGDSFLPANFAGDIKTLLSRPGVVAGAFRLGIKGRALAYRIIERAANYRSILLEMPYGDQGIFLSASTFHSLSGYSPIPFMEDFDLILRLRRRGKIAISESQTITSSRRWEQRGPWRNTLQNQVLVLAFLLGVSPSKLHQWYERRNGALQGVGDQSRFSRRGAVTSRPPSSEDSLSLPRSHSGSKR